LREPDLRGAKNLGNTLGIENAHFYNTRVTASALPIIKKALGKEAVVVG